MDEICKNMSNLNNHTGHTRVFESMASFPSSFHLLGSFSPFHSSSSLPSSLLSFPSSSFLTFLLPPSFSPSLSPFLSFFFLSSHPAVLFPILLPGFPIFLTSFLTSFPHYFKFKLIFTGTQKTY